MLSVKWIPMFITFVRGVDVYKRQQMDEELICDEGFLTLKEAKQVLLH